jgi:predicted dithiol-disulfide oxidoreductase (DUF899 family)
MTLPTVASRDDWLVARRALLAREKELTRARDALNTERRNLPMVRVDREYAFEGPEGRVTLLDLFDGRRQLIVNHFMFGPDWDEGCPSCSAYTDELAPGLIEHIRVRDTNFVQVARAPLAKIDAYRATRGWTSPIYSSFGNDFNFDFHVTLDESVAPVEYNYRSAEEHRQAGTAGYVEGDRPIERPGLSCFLRDGDTIYHTYSTFARGAEATGGAYYYLDLTALGRQEEWEEPRGRAAAAREAVPDFAV